MRHARRFSVMASLLLGVLFAGCSEKPTIGEQVALERLKEENPKLRQKVSRLESEKAQIEKEVQQLREQAAMVGGLENENARLMREVSELRRKVAAADAAEIYSVRRVFPEAVPFKYGAWLRVEGSDLVRQVKFSQGRAEAVYANRSEQRIKPNVTIWVLNRDGVVLDKLEDSWLIDSMGPGESHEKSWDLFPHMPEALVFSKWAHLGWDDRPAYVLVTGSKYDCDRLLNRTRAELERLNK